MPPAVRHTLTAGAVPHLIALAIFTLLGVLLTWPLALNLTAGVIGAVNGVDAYQNAWNLWWTAQALTSWRTPFFSPHLFYPDGVDLFWQMLGNVVLGEYDVPSGRAPARAIRLLLPPGEQLLTLQAPATPDPARAGAPISVRLFALDVRSASRAP